MLTLDALTLPALRLAYRDGSMTPAGVVQQIFEHAGHSAAHNIWVTRFSFEHVMRYVSALAERSLDDLPLYGIPFVIKDNIDLADVPTTAGCARYAYVPTSSATVVQRLLNAGAIPLGKTNLDQFATGLTGTRSPYGACRNSFDAEFISGGSSSGSAVAVALGLASFALGTDTAGSGRVPAALNNLVGLKPSVGRLSTHGVVPACRSLDCVSIFALTAEDAAGVLNVAEGLDLADPYSRRVGNRAMPGLRFGIPQSGRLQFFGDTEYQRLFDAAVRRMESLGGTAVDVDFTPFFAAAELLYEGPWIAERYAAVGEFIDAHPDDVHPVTRAVIARGTGPSAVDAYKAQYELQALKRASDQVWSAVDVLLAPTTGTIYTIAAVEADPLNLNTTLGYYTNFMNLLELAGVAVPAGFRADGLPFGVTLIAPDATDRALLALAGRFQRGPGATLGASKTALPAAVEELPALATGYVRVAVCGAHMEGLPLNYQLKDRGGYLLERTVTAAAYRLFALPGGPPYRPGLIRVAADGAAIEVEVWALPTEHVGSFLIGIPTPLGIGKVELADGAWISGFICEGFAAEGAIDITAYHGWREYSKAALS